MNAAGAVAAFVKTPGVSPVKTRLAADIGPDRAEAFYRLCLAATEAVVRQAAERNGLVGYWAVAEPEALDDPLWRAFARTRQGQGGLGERLDRVYRALLGNHPFVLLIGADAPLLSSDLVGAAADTMRTGRHPFAISRSGDGGYALFAGRQPLPRGVWTDVPYSSAETAETFVDLLRPYGGVAELPQVDDVDDLRDLAALVTQAADRPLGPEQASVVGCARRLLIGSSGDG